MEPRFLASHLTGVVGVSHATLNNWARAGHLNMLDAAERPARGTARLFTRLDVFRLVLLAEMTERGFSPGTASHVLEKAKVQLTEAAQLDPYVSIGSHLRFLLMHETMYDPGVAFEFCGLDGLKTLIENHAKGATQQTSSIVLIDLLLVIRRLKQIEIVIRHHGVKSGS